MSGFRLGKRRLRLAGIAKAARRNAWAAPGDSIKTSVEESNLLKITSNNSCTAVEPWLALPAKVRWKLFRQFHSPEQLKANPRFASSVGLIDDLRFSWQSIQVVSDTHSRKLLLENAQGVRCEAVALLPAKLATATRAARATACISSQPGCGVGCPFCATGTLGYRGNLSAMEIVEQVYWAGVQATQADRQLRNVVFMGMGEPMHNLDNVLQAIDWLTDERLFGIAQRRILVSTVGVPRAMLELVTKFSSVRLALSLHSALPEQRRVLVPHAVADLDVLRNAIRDVNKLQSESVWIEVVLLAGVNDSIEHAQSLIAFCEGLRVEVNLIPYNSTNVAVAYRASEKEVREAFAKKLRDSGIRTTIRRSLGEDASAACGQLTT